MSSLATFVRRINLTQSNTPRILCNAQIASRLISGPELAAAARWGVAVGMIAYWMVEPNFEETES